MAQPNKRWIIRDASGQIDGPFTTEKVLYKIGRGEFSGEESIANYPDGKWIPISQDPQFYDKLLEIISNNENIERSEDTRVLEFTRAQDTEVHSAQTPEPPPTPASGEEETVSGAQSERESESQDQGAEEETHAPVALSRERGRSRKTKKEAQGHRARRHAARALSRDL